jgi:hypothetical protein
MREGTVGLPFEFVACGFGEEERLRASGIAVAVDALLDSVVQDLAFGHRRGYMWLGLIRIGNKVSNVRLVSTSVKARPAVNTLCAVGMYMVASNSDGYWSRRMES